MRKFYPVLALLLLCATNAGLSAQSSLIQQCSTITTDPTRRFCNLVVEGIEIGSARVGLAALGGNPVPGMASTLGMRLGKVPRVAADLRVTAVKVDLPPIRRFGANDDIDPRVPSFNIDATVGLIDGASIFPTIGGFASVDVIASLGVVPLPESHAFNKSPVTFGIGARLGILRESFTAPGLTFSAMYRRIGDFDFGDRELQTEQSYIKASGLNALSLRGVLGKRVLFLSVSAGAGWDRYSTGDIEFGVANPGLVGGTRFDFVNDGFHTNRTTFFGGLQYTVLVLSFNAEFGVQKGGDEFTAQLPIGLSSTTENSAFFATLAFRVTI